MIHMTIQQLSSYLDAQLAPDSMERVGIHLSSCEECTGKFVAIERQADRLWGALRHDPGDLLSERFERMVNERILNGKRLASPRPAVVRPLPPLPETPPVPIPRAPARLAAAASAHEEGALAGAGEGVKRTAQAVATSMRSFTTPARREGERDRRRPVAWAAALILVVIAAGAGVVASRSGRLPSWSGFDLSSAPAKGAAERPATVAGAPQAVTANWVAASGTPSQAPPEWRETGLSELPTAPSPATGSPPESGAPAEASWSPDDDGGFETPTEAKDSDPAAEANAATTTLRGDELSPSGSPQAPRQTQEAPAPARESLSALPPRALPPAEAARRASDAAANDPSAPNYEAAAKAWEIALGSLHGDAYQEGRWRIAEARYRAWQMDPEEGQRASRATAAIRAYLIAAPPSEEREQARAWLTVIRESGFRYIESAR